MKEIEHLDLKNGDNIIYVNDNGDRIPAKVLDNSQAPNYQVASYGIGNPIEVINEKQVIHYRREFPGGGIA